MLTKTIKREFNLSPEKVTEPVQKVAGTAGSSETQYIMPPGDTECFNGSLDDVRIYNCALSASEIQQLYQGTL